jgi:DNA polymerase I
MKVSIIDGDNKCYSYLYSTQFNSPVIVGLTSIIKRVLRLYSPDIVVVAWEGMSNFRNDVDEDYKAHRNNMPDEAYEDCVQCREILKALNIPQMSSNRYEADDVIATCVNKLLENDDITNIYIHSDDKDLYQCLNSNRVVMESRFSKISKKYEDGLIDKDRFTSEFGFPPHLFAVYQMLIGDKSDNVTGVPGVGPKGATQFLCDKYIHDYINIDGTPDWVSFTCSIKNGIHSRIKDYGIDNTKRQWELVKLVTNVPISFDYRVFDNVLEQIIDDQQMALYHKQFKYYKERVIQNNLIPAIEEWLV